MALYISGGGGEDRLEKKTIETIGFHEKTKQQNKTAFL